jgi:hypothetical protein
MNAAKIILLCTGAAVLYGIAHDLITAHVAYGELWSGLRGRCRPRPSRVAITG